MYKITMVNRNARSNMANVTFALKREVHGIPVAFEGALEYEFFVFEIGQGFSIAEDISGCRVTSICASPEQAYSEASERLKLEGLGGLQAAIGIYREKIAPLLTNV